MSRNNARRFTKEKKMAHEKGHEPITILRRRQVEERVGLTRSTIYRRVAAGSFPAPISLGARAVGWLEAEISNWLLGQVAKSRKAG